MAEAPLSRTESVDRALDEGRTREDIVDELVAGGLSRSTAERFVDRRIAVRLPRPAAPAIVSDAAAASSDGDENEDSDGRAALVGGTFWLSLGCTVTGITYFVATPGQKYVIAYGAMIGGLIAFVRGFVRWVGAGVPFPLLGIVGAAIMPPIVIFSLVTLGRSLARSERRPEWVATPTKTAGENATPAPPTPTSNPSDEDQRAASEREAADRARAERHAARVTRALRELRPSEPMAACDAALALGDAQAREAIPALLALLKRPDAMGATRNCAASALVRLGETDHSLAFYLECTKSEGDLRRSAIIGFGEIGPKAASVALPFLAERLHSPYKDERYLTVESLARLGVAAQPLLQEAEHDADASVRQRATRALAELGR
jgi:hypothetical protein